MREIEIRWQEIQPRKDNDKRSYIYQETSK